MGSYGATLVDHTNGVPFYYFEFTSEEATDYATAKTYAQANNGATDYVPGSTLINIKALYDRDFVLGGINDAIVTAGAVGSISAKMRRLTSDVGAIKGQLPTALSNGFFKASIAEILINGTSAIQIQGTADSGSPTVGKPLLFAGKDSANNAQAVLTSTSRALLTEKATPLTPTTEASGTGNNGTLPATPGLIFFGLQIFEDASGTAEVIIHNGVDAFAPIVWRVKLVADQIYSEFFGDGFDVSDGLYVERVSGTTTVNVFTKVIN